MAAMCSHMKWSTSKIVNRIFVLLSKLLIFKCDRDQRWVAFISIVLVLSGLSGVTFSAQRHVHVLSSDHTLYVF